jgi:hypothetical protein
LILQAFSSEYITNILEQRQRLLPEPSPLLLTRRQDLLDRQRWPSRTWQSTTVHPPTPPEQFAMTAPNPTVPEQPLLQHLAYLQLPYTRNHFEDLARQAAEQHWAHVQYLSALMQGEADQRQDRAIQRRLKLARFPFIKTLDSFNGRPGRKKSIGSRSRTCSDSGSSKSVPMSFSSAASASVKPISASHSATRLA